MSPHSTRWTVIRGAARGDQKDQAEFARRYAPVIRAYLGARWRHTPLIADVDDAAQQVFLDCFKQDGALDRAEPGREGGFSAFLYGVVRNVARGIERTQARAKEHQAASELIEGLASGEESLAGVFDRAWATALMRDAAALHLERAQAAGPDAVRRYKLLTMRYGEGLPVREIAAKWETDAESLHREATKARAEFKLALMEVVRDMQGPDGVDEECSRLFAAFF